MCRVEWLFGDDATIGVLKTVLATVLVALAVYQVLLMSIGYGWIRVRFLQPGPASTAHRAVGDAIVLVTLLVAYLCVSGYDIGDAWEEGGRSQAHVVVGTALVAVLAVKVTCVRVGGAWGRLLPYLGISALVLFTATWATLALPNLGGG